MMTFLIVIAYAVGGVIMVEALIALAVFAIVMRTSGGYIPAFGKPLRSDEEVK